MPALPLDLVLQKLSEVAPLRLAEAWDNVGLLVGDRRTSIDRVMTCLTITPDVIDEALQQKVGLIVTHHPLPFKPLSRITSDSTTGQMLLSLIGGGVAVYSAHTAFDSSENGINAMWAKMIGLANIRALEPTPDSLDETLGAGRFGVLPVPQDLDTFANRVAELVAAPSCRTVPAKTKLISKVAIACGSGGALLAAAKRRGCDAMLTGEATFHTCLEAQASGVSLFLIGHFHSERFAMVQLVDRLASEFSDLEVFSSSHDVDPFLDRV